MYHIDCNNKPVDNTTKISNGIRLLDSYRLLSAVVLELIRGLKNSTTHLTKHL